MYMFCAACINNDDNGNGNDNDNDNDNNNDDNDNSLTAQNDVGSI